MPEMTRDTGYAIDHHHDEDDVPSCRFRVEVLVVFALVGSKLSCSFEDDDDDDEAGRDGADVEDV